MDDSRLIKLSTGLGLTVFVAVIILIILFSKRTRFAEEPPKILRKPGVQVIAFFLAFMLILGLGTLIYSALKGF